MSASASGCLKVVDNGADERRFVLAIVGDGFAAGDIDAFHSTASALLDGLRKIEPISWRLQDAINVYRLDTVSPQSGVSVGSGCGAAPASVNTALDATLCSDGKSSQSLTVNAGKVAATLIAAGLSWHLVVVIANTTAVGVGIAGNICAVTRGSGNVAPVARALARIVAGLGMEYGDIQDSYPSTREPTSPNLTLDSKGGKWKTDITPGFDLPSNTAAAGWKSWMVGAFEGGGNYAKGIYRPSQTCLMREDSAGFCFVCFKAMQKGLMPYHQTTGLSWLASLDRLGKWSPVRAVSPPAQPTPVGALATTALAGRMFVFTLANGKIGRNSADLTGHWESLQPIAMDSPGSLVVDDIACCIFSAEVLLAAVAKGSVWLATRPAGASWGAFAAVPSTGLPAGTTRIACAAATSNLLVFAAGPTGLWMTTRNPAKAWSGAWTEITTKLGGTAGAAVECIAAGAAANSATVHVFALSGGSIMHGRVNSAGMWQPAESVSAKCQGFSGATDLGCAVANEASVFLTAATPSGPVGAVRNAMGWPAAATAITVLPPRVSRISADILSGVILGAAA